MTLALHFAKKSSCYRTKYHAICFRKWKLIRRWDSSAPPNRVGSAGARVAAAALQHSANRAPPHAAAAVTRHLSEPPAPSPAPIGAESSSDDWTPATHWSAARRPSLSLFASHTSRDPVTQRHDSGDTASRAAPRDRRRRRASSRAGKAAPHERSVSRPAPPPVIRTARDNVLEHASLAPQVRFLRDSQP